MSGRKVFFAPGQCVLIDCPRCGEWIDADAESCKCGWTQETGDEWPDEDYDYDAEDEFPPSEEPPNV